MRKLLISIYTRWCKLLVHLFYPQKKELADWNACATKKYIFWQKILNINGMRKIPWPVHYTSNVGGDITTGYMTTPGMMPGIYINGMNGIRFGSNVYIASGVKIISANHDFKDYSKHTKANPVIIGDNVWIGANAVILPEVTIANGCIIGAGAVVTKSCKEENCIIAGNPAKKIRKK